MSEPGSSRIHDFRRVLARLDEVLSTPTSEQDSRDRDSAILRFELAYELSWKLIQDLVREEGLESNGPKAAFGNGFQLGWIQDETIWSDMIRDRNLAVHVYKESLADSLYDRLPGYADAFHRLLDSLPA